MISFGAFHLDAERRQLTKGSVPIQLEGRALDILIRLAAQPGQIVSRRALMEAVWPGRIVEDNNLAVHISGLRRLLGTGEGGRALIQTVPGRGYMLVSAPNPSGAAPPEDAGPAAMMAAGPAAAWRPANSFVGRVQECAALAAQIASHRLVTITAGGGMGKTRLALHVADSLAGTYPDGIHIAELASIRDPARAGDHVASLFPLGGADRPVIDKLATFLQDRVLLLVLDNCEHLVTPVAHLAAAILTRCPGVTMLATSREALGVAGEQVFRLHPLPVPPRGEAMAPEEALKSDAVRLFVDRASEMVPGFVLDAASVPAVVDVCTRLDGIALAIEMAVPRLRVLDLAQLADRLRESLGFLAAPARTAAPRHRTLRAVLDWSHALLPPGEQALLRRLSVFAGAIDFEAVLAIARTPGQSDLDVLDQLAALVDKSMAVTEPGPGGARYRLLETVRDYARDRLAESGETGLRRRHAAHYTAVFEALATAWPTALTTDWQPRAAAEAAELRAGLAWCFGAEGDTALGLRLAGFATVAWWDLPGMPLREARQWFDRAAAHIGPGTPADVAARVWFGISWRDMRHDDAENRPAAERAVALFRQSNDKVGLAAALWRAASSVLTLHPPAEVAATLGEAEHLLRQIPPGKWLGLCLIRLGDFRARLGETQAGLAAYEEGLAIATSTGHLYGMTNGGSNMADLLYLAGMAPEALAQLRSLHATLPLGPRTPLTSTMTAHLFIAGHDGEALDAIAEVLDMAPSIGYGGALARSIETLALMRTLAGDAPAAARMAGYARATLPGAIRWAVPKEVFGQLDAALRSMLSDTERRSALEQGAAWDEATAVVMARAALRRQRIWMAPPSDTIIDPEDS